MGPLLLRVISSVRISPKDPELNIAQAPCAIARRKGKKSAKRLIQRHPGMIRFTWGCLCPGGGNLKDEMTP